MNPSTFESWAADPIFDTFTRTFSIGSHILFGGLDGHYDDPEWEVMRANYLLTVEEIAIIRAFRGQRVFLAMNWALDEAYQLLGAMPSNPVFGINKNFVYQEMQRAVFSFHNNAGAIMSLLAVPVPYPYFHLLAFQSHRGPHQ